MAFVPEEDRVSYSAMTGQSLYYQALQLGGKRHFSDQVHQPALTAHLRRGDDRCGIEPQLAAGGGTADDFG